MRHRRQTVSRAFALVLAMFLVVLLATSGVGLALNAVSESTIARWRVHDLDHKLAVDSALNLLPKLLSFDQPAQLASGAPDKQIVSVTAGLVEVTMWLKPEGAKLRAGGEQSEGTATEQLRPIATENALPVENISPSPVKLERDDDPLPLFLCFDQLVRPTGIEEIYPRHEQSRDADDETVKTVSWSDKVSFWQSASGTTYGVNVVSRHGDDERHWYAVVAVASNETRILFLERV